MEWFFEFLGGLAGFVVKILLRVPILGVLLRPLLAPLLRSERERAARPEKQKAPLVGVIIGVLLWALLAVLLGPRLTSGVAHLADAGLGAIKSWTGRPPNPATPGLGQLLVGLVLAIVKIPIVLVAGGALLALAILAVIGQLAEHFHLLPFVGAVFGFFPGWHSRPFWLLGQRLASAMGFVTVSTIEIFTFRGLTNRLWAASPLLVLLPLGLIGTGAVVHVRATAKPTIRYQPTPAWRTSFEFDRWRFELQDVLLTKDGLETTIRATNLRRKPASFRIARATTLKTVEGIMSGEKLSVHSMDSLRTPVAPGQSGDVTLRFDRPGEPHRQWCMTFVALTTAKAGIQCPFEFDLSNRKGARPMNR